MQKPEQWEIHTFTPTKKEPTAFEIHPVGDEDGLVTIASLDVFGEVTLKIARKNAHLIAAAPEMLTTLQCTGAALSDLLHQVHQMKGMFPDEDETIADAIGDAEDALKLIQSAIAKAKR